MRRLLRWALNLVALVSALLFVATCVLWVRSRTPRNDRFLLSVGRYHFEVGQYNTHQFLQTMGKWTGPAEARLSCAPMSDLDPSGRYEFYIEMGEISGWRALGFDGESGLIHAWATEDGVPVGMSPRHIAVALPYWAIFEPPFLAIAVATALTPLGWVAICLIARHQRLRRCKPAQCHSCGYDLRATPERCPECGTAPARKAAS